MGEYGRGYRSSLRDYRAGNGRKIEIVRGNVFSANLQTNIYTPPPAAILESQSPEPPMPFPPDRRPTGGCFSDPEMKRRRRVASYKAYGVEGKVKAPLCSGFRRIKGVCSDFVHGS